jgi:mono/diheme cytochrome c family protein
MRETLTNNCFPVSRGNRTQRRGRASVGSTATALAVWLVLAGSHAFPVTGNAAALAPAWRTFILDHCADCHDDEMRKAGLNLVDFEFRPDDEASLATWVRVHDRVKAGEMPPVPPRAGRDVDQVRAGHHRGKRPRHAAPA